ncbi:MAG: TonB-dependent receptor, partial [Betaproteobacteria bacterium]|nr:TonB-dependent receptor [Betaproteobacteria bacterium]
GRPPSPSAFEKIPVFKGLCPWRPATVRRLFLALGLTLQDLAGAAEDVLPVVANSPVAPRPSTGSTRSPELEAVIVTANPLGGRADELAAPVQILFGPQLDARRSVTIGEMLSGLPGVSASAFGPNASRPIMRGLDGDRLKVLSNGVPVLDASAASPDHAVAAESLLLDRVEVLRGPAALRFGGGAIGGVVNLIDGRIPQTPIEGMTAQADLRQGGAARESAGTVRLDAGDGRFAWHVDGLARRSGDLTIPGFSRTQVLRAQEADPYRDVQGRLPNSAANAQGMTFGLSRTDADGHMGLALSQNSQRYGTTLFESRAPIAIDLVQTRLDGSLRQAGVAGGTLALVGAWSQYRHAELAREMVGTEFRNQGGDARLEWSRQSGLTRWLVGGQLASQTLRVTGEEAYLPVNRSDQSAAYVVIDHSLSKSLRIEAGGRVEQVGVRSEGGRIRDGWIIAGESVGQNSGLPPGAGSGSSADSSAGSTPGATATDRRFGLRSVSLGSVWTVSPTTSLSLHASHTERAPNAQELFADGVHTATAIYEVGNPGLRTEQSKGLNLGWRETAGPWRWRVDVFEQHFERFISLRGLGEALHPADGQSIPAAGFSSGAARLRGSEFDLTWVAWERGARRLSLEAGHDQVRITDSEGLPLPRIPAQRWRLGAAWRDGNLSARLEALNARRVSRIAIDETPTPAWTRLDAWLGWNLAADWQLQLIGRNLANAVIRDHTSFLKDISLAGGRSVLLALRCQI